MAAYRRYAWFTLLFCLAVILWGAFVRASGSGAGCGSHWPLCDGEVIPRAPDLQKAIEYTHRLSSGLSLLFVLGLFVATFRMFPPGFQRKAAGYALVAILLEALIGAGLVLFALVGVDRSAYRAFSISLHLVNTLFLLAALTITALAPSEARPRWRWPAPDKAWVRGLLFGFALLGAMGALTALGDTLFPVGSVSEGWQRKFEEGRHFLERIRIFHPLLAVTWVGCLWLWTATLVEKLPELRRLAQFTLGLAATNIGLGLLNVILLAPIWMQIVHLLVADLLWILFVSLVFSAASRWR